MLPEGKLSEGVLPHFLSKDFYVELDLLLHWLAEPCVCALEEKYEGVNGSNPLDLLSEGNSVLTIPSFSVSGSRGVDDCDAGIGWPTIQDVSAVKDSVPWPTTN